MMVIYILAAIGAAALVLAALVIAWVIWQDREYLRLIRDVEERRQ